MKNKALLFIIVLISISVQAQFGSQQIISFNSVQSIFPVDIDGDGDMDVISCSRRYGQVSWYENIDGAGTFGPEIIIASELDIVEGVHAADIDGDNDMDILSASFGDGKIIWYENLDGQGTFADKNVITIDPYAPIDISAADIDGDGDLDVLVTTYSSDSIMWYENLDGLGNFGPTQIITTFSDEGRSVQAADFDGDGDMDVLGGSWRSNTITWYENLDGQGAFGEQNVISTDEFTNATSEAFAIDIDGDGDMDVVAGSWEKVSWFENTNGLGDFGSQQIIDSGQNTGKTVYAADINNDENIDIIASSSSVSNHSIGWYESTNGLGGFGPRQIIPSENTRTQSLYAVDFNGDGNLDVLSGGVYISWYENLLVLGTQDFYYDSISVYPNPTNSLLNIDVQNKTKIKSVLLFDVLGKKLFNKKGNNQQVDIGNLSNGLYLLKIETENGVFSKRIIKE